MEDTCATQLKTSCIIFSDKSQTTKEKIMTPSMQTPLDTIMFASPTMHATLNMDNTSFT